jgi:hypothetical protein
MRSRNERQDRTGPGRPRTRGRRSPRTLVAAVGVAVAAVTMLVPSAGPASAAGSYTAEIVNRSTGLRADVEWASTADLTRVFLYGNNASASQEFNILDDGNGFFRIQARHSGKCLMLDWRSGYYTNGTGVVQYGCQAINYGPGEWRVITSGCINTSGFCMQRHMLQNRYTGRCLDANAPSGQPGWYSYLQQWDCIRTGLEWNWKNQDFDLVSTSYPVLH